MKNKKEKTNARKVREKGEIQEKRTLALSQILILVIATVAFSWMIGSEVKEVSATLGADCGTSGGVCVNQNACTGGGTRDYANDGGCLPYSDSNQVEVCCIPSGGSTCSSAGGTCRLQSACTGTAYSAGSGCGSTQVCCIQPCADRSARCLEQNSCLSGGGYTVSLSNSECIAGTICCGSSTGGAGGSTAPPNEGKFDPFKYLGEAATACLTINAIISGACTKLLARAFGKPLAAPPTPPATPPVTPPTPPTTPPAPSGPGFLSEAVNSLWGQVIINAAAGALTAIGLQKLMKWAGAGERNLGDINTASWIGAALGTVFGTLAVAVKALGASWYMGPIISIATVVLAVGIKILVGYQLYSQEIYTFRVSLWQSPTGGSECNKCNSLKIGSTNENACSEYICHSYGASCEWENSKEQYETCYESDPGDTRPPSVHKPLKYLESGESVFPTIDTANYDYASTSGLTRLIYTGKGAGEQQCIPPFTAVTIAVNTTENAYCKIRYNEAPTGDTVQDQFENSMQEMLEGSAYTINHTVPLSEIPNEGALLVSGYQSTNGGIFRFYIKCQDKRGNINPLNYEFRFCVQKQDINPPYITETNPPRNSYITYGVVNVTNFKVFLNEPAECKWDTRSGVTFTNMANAFAFCSKDLNTPLEGGKFGCITNLTNFKNRQENTYYIICKDQPLAQDQTKRNTGKLEEIVFTGTGPLIFTNVLINDKPNNSLIVDDEEDVEVKIDVTTFGGATGAQCSYKLVGEGSYVDFTNDGNTEFSHTNTETLLLSSDNYKFLIQCKDNAVTSSIDNTPNTNTTMINFTIKTDTTPPTVVRVYRDENRRQDTDNLKIITNEKATCVYSTTNCDYEVSDATGVMESSEDGLEHYTPWSTENDYYIKCTDEFEHSPSGCSIIARPFEISKGSSE